MDGEPILGRRVVRRRTWYTTFVGLALVAPLITLATVATASDERLHGDCTHVTGEVVATHDTQPLGAPIHNVTIISSPDPQFAPGQAVQIYAPSYESGAQEVEVGRRMGLAITPYRMHDPATGNDTFQGWRLCDAKVGALWTSQEGAMVRAASAGVVFAGAGAGLAFALDPRRRREGHPRRGALAIAVSCGILLAVYTAAVLSRSQNPLFPHALDDGLVAGGLGIMFFIAVLALAIIASLRLRPLGAATIVIASTCLLTLSLAQLLVSLRMPAEIVADPYAATLFVAAALAGAAAHRSFPRWLPLVFAAALLLLAATILYFTSVYGVATGIVYGGVPAVLAACAMADAIQRWTIPPTRR